MRHWLAFALLVSACRAPAWSVGVARAEGPHTRASCPEGAVLTGPPDGPQFCVPQNCASDEECGVGRICRDLPLCIETVGGITGTKTAVGKCTADGTCTHPAVCEQGSKRCVRAGLAERYRTSCGCAVPGLGGRDGLAAAAAVLALAIVLAHRRAARRRGV